MQMLKKLLHLLTAGSRTPAGSGCRQMHVSPEELVGQEELCRSPSAFSRWPRICLGVIGPAPWLAQCSCQRITWPSALTYQHPRNPNLAPISCFPQPPKRRSSSLHSATPVWWPRPHSNFKETPVHPTFPPSWAAHAPTGSQRGTGASMLAVWGSKKERPLTRMDVELDGQNSHSRGPSLIL